MYIWSTTKLFFSTTQTISDSDDEIVFDSSPKSPVFNDGEDTQSSHDLQQYMQAIIIGCICAAAFCLVVLAICIVIIYLNHINSAALASIVDVDADADLARVATSETVSVCGSDAGDTPYSQQQQRPSVSSRVLIRDASGKYVDPNRRVTNLPKPKPRKKRKISHRRGKLSRHQLAQIAAKMGENEREHGQQRRNVHVYETDEQDDQYRGRQHERGHSAERTETENIEISIVLPGGAPSLGNNLSNDTLDGYKSATAGNNKRLSELQVLKEETGDNKFNKPLKARLPSNFSNALHVQISDIAEADDASESSTLHEGVPIERIPSHARE